MATGSYRIKTANDQNSIYYRFKQGAQFDVEISTDIQVPDGRWSSTKQQVLPTIDVDYKNINLKLKELDVFVNKEFNDSKISGKKILITGKWLKEKMAFYFKNGSKSKKINEQIFFADFIKKFIEDAPKRKTKNNTPIKRRTIQDYQTTLNKIEDFEKFMGEKVNLDSVDLNFHSNFIHYLETVAALNDNTIGGYINNVKLFCRSAILKRHVISMDFKEKQFYSPSNTTHDIYLQEEEIIKIYNTAYPQDYLDNARDWLIIGLRTGLRVSDLLTLTRKSINDGFIELRNKKTDYPVIIPLHRNVSEILEKRDGSFPRKISDTNFNVYIKEVAKIAGLIEMTTGGKISERTIEINGKKETIHRKVIGEYPKHELVSSHICRRTFATLLYGKIDTLTIMKITGHQTERQFLAYVKITPKEYAEKLKAYWKLMGQLEISNN
ncbi:tyrosine-type recombinase/integrase [Flavobacterium hydrophilum]|uniref:Integrase n=1 Tax=Flavobacterium hydrophilum TaxID=2211445 RepID=A0A2V4C1Q6_9FLAO|nr:phage integrase SAM-like domain-containing protein [Flavobacterium hydrophilum]PXY45231.1 integrase [Flavobacterium hydrophilum]